MSMIRWLHISDLHFNDEDMSTIMLRDELPKFLSKNNFFCDYVFCTGDIRVGRMGIFPDEAAAYLKQICSATKTDTNRLFIVPGNHDIDISTEGRDESIARVMFQRNGYYDSSKGKIDEEDLTVIHGGQADFRGFLSKVFNEGCAVMRIRWNHIFL